MSMIPRVLIGALELTSEPYAVEFGSDYGSPENQVEVMLSQLRDGEVISSTRTGNRTMEFTVLIEGADLDTLADAEADLIAECDKPQNLLTLDPGDGIGAPSVFQTFRVVPRYERDDELEIQTFRRYVLTITALPFARSAEVTTIGSDTVGDAVTISDDCQSTTGWSAMAGKSGNGYSPTFAVDSTSGNYVTGTGSIKVTPSGTPITTSGISRQINTAFGKVLSINAAGGGYLTFAMRTTWASQIKEGWITSSGGGRQAVTFMNAGALGNGFSRYAAAVPNLSTITLLEVEVQQGQQAGTDEPTPPLWVDTIGLATTNANAQKNRAFEVLGSARTEGTFTISSPSGVAGLGDVVLYTTPDRGDGFRPDMKRWLVSGTTTADSTAITGTYVTLQSTAAGIRTFEAPAASFRPGAYAIIARVKSDGSLNIQPVVKAQMLQGSTLVGGIESTSQDTVTLAGTTAYELIRLGVLHLPPTVPDPTNTTAKIRFSVTDELSTTRLDELLVFPMEDAALTWVQCGTGTASASVSSRLWVDGPSLDYPRGRLQVGTTLTRSDARTVRPVSRGSHLLYPGAMFSYLLCSGSATASMAISYFPAWHTHARRL